MGQIITSSCWTHFSNFRLVIDIFNFYSSVRGSPCGKQISSLFIILCNTRFFSFFSLFFPLNIVQTRIGTARYERLLLYINADVKIEIFSNLNYFALRYWWAFEVNDFTNLSPILNSLTVLHLSSSISFTQTETAL